MHKILTFQLALNNIMQRRSISAFVLLTLLAGLIAGCSHYRLGEPGELPFKTVYVPPVKNSSFAPQVQAMLTQQIIAQLQEQQAIKIVSSPPSDVTLYVKVTNYDRDVASTQASDTFLAESFNLIMEAEVTLADNRTSKNLISNRSVSASQQAFITGGFQPSEYQAMPVLTEDVANKVTNMVTSVW
ncbi:LptE family protein [Rubellicoccus peritrichatus]|uniref:LptE family protein n=1 Tax=Rubellicoccus peritrichatus TaxID=3080537 RepID=A0AAQ3QUR9_9BACT|nr:LptE family protein [Puniceicoccus sp. CR14]WOO40683.1 LptE family protein [Puniceicoccus sp. CR14]